VELTSEKIGGGVVKYSFDWVSDGAGDVSGNLFGVIRGRIIQVGFVPDSGGTQPTAAYDVLLNDVNDFDLLGGAGADLSNTLSTLTPVVTPLVFDGGQVDLVISNAGDGKGGIVSIWVGPLRP